MELRPVSCYILLGSNTFFITFFLNTLIFLQARYPIHIHIIWARMDASYLSTTLSFTRCLVSQYHSPFLRRCIFQYRPFPYVVCHISVLKSPLQDVSQLSLNLYCMRCLISQYTGCPRNNGQNFGRVFLMLNYTDITQNTYIQSWTFTEIMAREVWNFDSCYTLIDYQIHIKTGRNMWFL